MTNISKLPWVKGKDGVYIKHLARDDMRNFQFDIIRLEPNTTFPEHQHADVEWVYVLKGNFKDEFGSFKKGDFKINPKHSKHTLTTGNHGCELLICWSVDFLSKLLLYVCDIISL